MAPLKNNRLLVFASGRGSNFEAIATAIENGQIENAQIVGLFSNKSTAPVLEKAARLKIPTHVIESKNYKHNSKFDREKYEKDLLKYALTVNPDWIILAGYMLILGREFIKEFEGKIINIHPSLLPKYKGLDAQKQALEAKETETGCTVHIVTEEMDAGPIIAQSKVKILPEDTVERLIERLLAVEHATYVRALKKLCS